MKTIVVYSNEKVISINYKAEDMITEPHYQATNRNRKGSGRQKLERMHAVHKQIVTGYTQM